MPNNHQPLIAITPGDPAGIGPDILIQAAQQQQSACLIVFADPALLKTRAQQLKLPLNLHTWNAKSSTTLLPASSIWCQPIHLVASCTAGYPDPKNIPYVLRSLQVATDACLAKDCDALVTGPVNKGLFLQAGIPFSGHTEFLAQQTNSKQVVMMLATEGLRIALMTTHLPLNKVSDAITPNLINSVIQVLHNELSSILKRPPKIYVLGLNPHAGDSGALGSEEKEIIIPTLNELRKTGIRLVGPISADTAFSPENLGQADIFLAMYHDQGLPVLKFKGFGKTVNVTLGLNIIRTSVDHGTAFELAGTGQADASSLQFAINTAISLRLHHV